MHHAGQKHTVKVWDLPVRLFHWSLVALVAALWISGELGQLDLHMRLGTGVLALALFRLGWGFAGSRTARFGDFVRGPAAIIAYARSPHLGRIGHNPMGALSVLALLTIVLVQAGSGLFASDDIVTNGPLTHLVSSKTVSRMSSIHRIAFKLLLAAVALHLAAIAFYRFVKKDDLIRPMLTGEKAVAPGTEGNSGGNPLVAVALAAAAAAIVWGGLAVAG